MVLQGMLDGRAIGLSSPAAKIDNVESLFHRILKVLAGSPGS
jgi:hypothetical protein